MLYYCILTSPWLVPPNTNHSFIKNKQPTQQKQNLSKTDQSVAICILRILLLPQKFWTITTAREKGISTIIKKNQLKSSFWIKMKNHLMIEKFLSFSSRIKQPSPRLVIKVLLDSNTKINTKNTITTELWKCGRNKTEIKR